ncbi:TetR/AcrR family transcriptional regulator [Haloactinopolyspora sp.]|uniref:TetR/AcrR family transcriptional regulator n=1 Tax=Haloactinopolyspora sp. TaxID=1966353 RepID=UPI0026173D2F|nr:TetR/AcrR family transcriptional regulator [Haloactinopolyspora sp.]
MTTRDRILDAAARIMRTEGVARATTRQIAREAGYSEATLYKHFSDKADLFKGVLRERMPSLVATLEQLHSRIGQGSVRDNLVDVTTAALAFYEDSLPMTAGLFAERHRLDEHVAGLRRGGGGPGVPNQVLAQYLRAEQAAGRIGAHVVPEAVAALLFGACLQRALLAAFAEDDGADRVETATTLVDTLLTGIAGQ